MFLLPSQGALIDIAVADERALIAVGDNFTVVRSDDAGASWVTQTLASEHPGSVLRGVALADLRRGVAIGRVLESTSPRALVFTTRDGGATWASATSPEEGPTESYDLRDVCMTSEGDALAAGFAFSGDLVLLSRDFGDEWQRISTDPARFLDPSGVACAEGGDMWVTGVRSGPAPVLLHSAPDGAWSVVDTISGGPSHLNDVEFSDSGNGIAVGPDAILSTSDGGASWTREPHPYDGREVTLGAVAVDGPRALVAGVRPATSTVRAGVILVRDADEGTWVEAELPSGTEDVGGVAFAR